MVLHPHIKVFMSASYLSVHHACVPTDMHTYIHISIPFQLSPVARFGAGAVIVAIFILPFFTT